MKYDDTDIDPQACRRLILALVADRIGALATEFYLHGDYDKAMLADALAWATELQDADPVQIEARLLEVIKAKAKTRYRRK